jgi:hypothetical protein
MDTHSPLGKFDRARLVSGSLCLLLAATLILAVAVAPAWSSVTGSISGTVKDSSGAVIPNAAVTALNTGTGISQSVEADAVGFYVFPALPVGVYDITIRHAGFKEYRQTGLALDATVALRINATLEVGAVAQEVTVQSATVHVDTTSTQMGEIIGGVKMTTLPLNGRAYTDLLALQPGVVAINAGTYSSQAVSGSLNSGNLSVGGQRESANGFVVNGGSVQESTSMGTSIIPDLDSIAEFRIITNNGEAEYGNYAGAQVYVVTKSGTNQFHGSGFEFLRNSSMDSRNFYSSDRGILRQNQFGGTAGGPIRHDKVFFFGDYQGMRRTTGVDSGLVLVPSPAERTGDLSGVADQLTGVVNGGYWANQLSQGLGYPVTPGEPYYSPGCTSSSQCVFPNAQVPQSVWAAPVKNSMQYIPQPNAGAFFTTSAYPDALRDNKSSGRIDANTRAGMISGYYFWDDYNHLDPNTRGNVPGFSNSTIGRAQNFNLGDTKSFGPASVNEFRLNYVRNSFTAGEPVGGVGPTLSSQGFTGIVPGGPEGVEPVSFNSFSIGINPYYSRHINNTYQVLDNFSKVVRTHTLKFGANYHYDQITDYEFGAKNGTFTFDGTETGIDFADFLIGAPADYEQGAQIPMYTRGRYFGVYGQDSWRYRPNLTFDCGLRWEFSTPWWETHNQIETLVPGLQSRVFPGAPTGWVFPGDPGIPPTLAPTRYNNFAPRVGLAYAPNASGGFWGKLLGRPGETSIRAGFGVFFTAFEDITSFNEVGDAPYGFFWVSPVPPLFATPFMDRATGNNEGQRFPPPFPPLNVSSSNPDNNIDWSKLTPIISSPGFFHDNRLPYSEHYSFSIQRQFGANTLLSLAYVGTQGHRLLSDLEANPGNPALCLSVSQDSQVLPGTGTCGPDGENGVYYPITGGVINGTRSAFPNTIGSNGYFATMGNSNYNSFQTSLRHTSGRAEFLLGYTWSKVIDNASNWGTTSGGQVNVVNHKLGKAISAFDMTHNFVASYSYELPFDKLIAANRPRLTRGWIITGVTRFATGLPVRIRENDDRSLLGTRFTGPTSQGIDEPDFTPGPLNITDPRKYDPATGANPYFNESLFAQEPLGRLGTSSREFFHGPGLNSWDLAVHKDIRLTEGKTLQLRGEFFNAFNHAQFGSPTGNVLSGAFGVVTSARLPRIGQVAAKILF